MGLLSHLFVICIFGHGSSIPQAFIYKPTSRQHLALSLRASSSSANIRPDAALVLVHRLRRWANIKQHWSSGWYVSRQTQNMCITFVQRRPKVFDVGPKLYKCYANVLCLLGWQKRELSTLPLSTAAIHILRIPWRQRCLPRRLAKCMNNMDAVAGTQATMQIPGLYHHVINLGGGMEPRGALGRTRSTWGGKRLTNPEQERVALECWVSRESGVSPLSSLWHHSHMLPVDICYPSAFATSQCTNLHLEYERVYLPLYEVADTPFHIQVDVICSDIIVLLVQFFFNYDWCQ